MSGNITSCWLGSGPELDFSGAIEAVTITNCTLRKDAVLRDPLHWVTFTNDIIFEDAAHLTDVTLDLGPETKIGVIA